MKPVLIKIFFNYYNKTSSDISSCLLLLYVKLPGSDVDKILVKLRNDLRKRFPKLIHEFDDYEDIVNTLSDFAKDGEEGEVKSAIEGAFQSLSELYAIKNPHRAILTKKYDAGYIDPDFEKVIKKLVNSSVTLKDFIKGLRKVAFDLDFNDKKVSRVYLKKLKDVVEYVS
mgnify:CR=1 FL=1